MAFYYQLQSCDNASVIVDAQFQAQQTFNYVFLIYGLAPGQGVGNCWRVYGTANSGQFVYPAADYGLNGCSSCNAPTPAPSATPPTSYSWQFNAVQGNGSQVKPTSCVNCPVTVWSDVQTESAIVCGTKHFWLDSNLTLPFIGSNQDYNAVPGVAAATGEATFLIANDGTVTDKFDCNGNNICLGPVPTPVPTAPVPTAPVPSPVPTAPIPTPVPTAPSPAPVVAVPDYCLSSTNSVTFEVLGGVNKYVFGGNYGLYGSGTGVFVLDSVSSSHPIAFQNFGITSLLQYDGQYSVGTKTGLDGNVYEYFYGDVTVTVTGDYGRISYECYNHGYMGGENNLLFDNVACPNLQPPVIPPQGDPALQYTLTYSDGVKGWPSFYSYFPDWMLGMNNYFYSFKAGNMYRHNTNSLRNNYYDVQYNSTLTSVFNEMPLENKLFKTINLESDKAWSVSLDSDIQTGASIGSAWFEKKEGAWFAFIRNNGTQPAQTKEYPMRSVNGIGRSTSVSVVGTSTTINFATNPLIAIGSDLSVGDIIYFAPPPYSAVEMAGQVTAINIDLQNNTNNIVIDNSISGAVAISLQDGFIMYIKNQQAESNGVLGHYCLFTITNTDSTATELFAVESEVMKSYP